MLQYIKPYRHYAAMTIVFMVGEVLVDLYQPRLMESIVNEGVLGLNHGGVPDLPLVAQTGLSMVLIVLLGGFCGVMGAICVNSARRISATTSARTVSSASCICRWSRSMRSARAL